MVIRIAICDDESYICSQLESMLEDVLSEMNITFDIEVFESGEGLCTELKRQHFDLVFLDIELPDKNGVDVGKYIRDVLKDEVIQIVYISGKDGYAMKLFEIRPMNFLVKPIEREKVKQVIEKYKVVTEQNYPVFSYAKAGVQRQVRMSEIIYFENLNRKILICTRDFEDEFYGSIEDVFDRVCDRDFILIHKSIIVNYRFVKNMGYKEVVMSNNKILPISQSKRMDAREKYMQIRKRVR